MQTRFEKMLKMNVICVFVLVGFATAKPGFNGAFGNQFVPNVLTSPDYALAVNNLNEVGLISSDFGNANFGRYREPSNYHHKYDVDAPEYGVQQGHEEIRQGDVTQGRYYVLLPDGRRQIVEYTAGPDGYKPRIRYEPAGGYNDGYNGGYNQYRNVYPNNHY